MNKSTLGDTVKSLYNKGREFIDKGYDKALFATVTLESAIYNLSKHNVVAQHASNMQNIHAGAYENFISGYAGVAAIVAAATGGLILKNIKESEPETRPFGYFLGAAFLATSGFAATFGLDVAGTIDLAPQTIMETYCGLMSAVSIGAGVTGMKMLKNDSESKFVKYAFGALCGTIGAVAGYAGLKTAGVI